MGDKSTVSIPWPMQGLMRHGPYHEQPIGTTFDAVNVRPDGTIKERQRGGSRPGLTRVFPSVLGAPVRLIDTLGVVDTLNNLVKRMTMVVSGGKLWREFNAGILEIVSDDNGINLATDRLLLSAPHNQRLFIADHSATLLTQDGAEIGSTAANTVVTVDTVGSPTAGIWTIIFAYPCIDQTGNIQWDATMADVKSVIESLSWVTAGDITVTGSDGGPWIIEFGGTLAGKRVGMIPLAKPGFFMPEPDAGIEKVSTTWGGQNNLTIHSGIDMTLLGITTEDYAVRIYNTITSTETQVVDLASPTGGTFRLKYGDTYTVDINYGATAAQVKEDLEAINDIPIESADVTGAGGGPWTIKFINELAETEVPLLEVDASALTGGGTPTVTQSIRGGPPVDCAYGIASVTADTLTLTNSPGETDELTFEVMRTPKYYDWDTNELKVWEAAEGKGCVPLGCPLIALWRDRIVMAGNPEHQWYMSRQGDPFDWDYEADDRDLGRAVFGANTIAGELAEPITALIPHADDSLVMGARTSLWILRGDPTYGGVIDNLSWDVGVLSKGSWCYAPDQKLIVFLSLDGIWAIPPGGGQNQSPQSLSRELLPQELVNLDFTDTVNTITMEYDVRYRGIHINITNESDALLSSYYWFDWEARSFWRSTYGSDFQPTAVHGKRSKASNSSLVYLGGRDGVIRSLDNTKAQDDGVSFSSHVLIGPINISDDDYRESLMTELHGVVARTSGDVTWSLYPDVAAEDTTTAATALMTGTWSLDTLNCKDRPRARAHSVILKLEGAEDGVAWAIEHIQATLKTAGKLRV